LYLHPPLEGDFIWHDHKNTDETLVVLEGDLRIDFRDGAVHVSAGEMLVVPKASNTSHMPTRGQIVADRATWHTQHRSRRR